MSGLTRPGLGAALSGGIDVKPFNSKNPRSVVGINKSYTTAFIDAGVGYLGGKGGEVLGSRIPVYPHPVGAAGAQAHFNAYVVYPGVQLSTSLATQSLNELAKDKYGNN